PSAAPARSPRRSRSPRGRAARAPPFAPPPPGCDPGPRISPRWPRPARRRPRPTRSSYASASIRSASVSEGGADERLQVRHRVVVREYGDDAIALGLRQDGLRLRALHEGDRSDLIALPCERELTLRQVAVALLEEGALVGGAHVGQTDREIGLQGELLLPHLVCGVVALHPCGFQAPLAREPLEDRDAQPDREAGRRAL